MVISNFFDSIYRYSQKKVYDDFISSMGKFKIRQEQVLFKILKNNQSSEFGKKHDFQSIRSVSQFRNRVAIQNDLQLSPAIERMLQGEEGILLSDKVIGYLRSAGGRGISKVIPYTKELVSEFNAGTSAMLYGLFEMMKNDEPNSAYWIVGPEFIDAQIAPSGISIGHQESLDIFYQFDRHFFKNQLRCDAELKSIKYPHYLDQLAKRLMGMSNLQILFAYSPLTVIELLNYITQSFPQRSITDLWPKLRYLCCWKDGGARFYLPLLQKLLPLVTIIPREILSAEALLTISLPGHPYGLLAFNSHFYEFQDVEGKVVGAENLLRGFCYHPIVTTSGGLYRYHTGDVVEVMGHVEGLPMLRYVSAVQGNGDFDERLDEERLSLILEHLYVEFNITPRFHMIEPASKKNPRYILFLEHDESLSVDLHAVEQRFEEMLMDSHQYNLCHTIGEIQPVKVVSISNGWSKYVQAMIERGCKSYELISPALISPFREWEKVYVAELT